MKWNYNGYPIAYEIGNWDGKRSNEVVVEDDDGEKYIARLYEGFLDGSEFKDWIDNNGYTLFNIIKWIELPD